MNKILVVGALISATTIKRLAMIVGVLFLTACFDSDKGQTTAQQSVNLGKATFETNCATCHGQEGQGLTKDWKAKQADGKFPAPPVNGTAHAWHHSPDTLMNTINNGGVKLGGWMPGFKDKLSEAEKQAVLKYVHDLWPQEIQTKYDARFK